jgi:hypothetical protein
MSVLCVNVVHAPLHSAKQVRDMLQNSDPDPSMYGALPPGAWWEVANGAEPVMEPYADKAGDAAIRAARWGDLELRDVCFAYPVRKEVAGGWWLGKPGTPAACCMSRQCGTGVWCCLVVVAEPPACLGKAIAQTFMGVCGSVGSVPAVSNMCG